MNFSIVQVFEDGKRLTLGSLNEDIVYIGREPPEGGIVIDSKAVSRGHAVFVKISNLCFYKDLGSSNGSWLNGQHVGAGVPYLLRINDTIQLADSVINLVGEDDSYNDAPAVVTFARGEFLGLFPIPEVGKVVSIGGSSADLKLDVDMGELPVVVVEKRANFVCAYPVARGNKATINDNQLSQLVQLNDRDMITVSPYTLVISIPSSAQLASIGSEDVGKNLELKETFSGWEDDHKPISRNIFGTTTFSDNVKDFEESERSIVSDMRPSSRFNEGSPPPQDRARQIEERIFFVLGFVMVLVILSMVLWWFIR